MCNENEGTTANRKPWGMQYPVLRRNTIHVDEISVVPGGYCSVHKHLHKSNLFHVMEGRLAIVVFNEERQIIRTESLRAGEECIIPEGQLHMFWSQSGCIAQEVYLGTAEHINVVHEDIERSKLFEFGGVSPLLAGVPCMVGIYLQEAGS